MGNNTQENTGVTSQVTPVLCIEGLEYVFLLAVEWKDHLGGEEGNKGNRGERRQSETSKGIKE